jgi:hypothetical protein
MSRRSPDVTAAIVNGAIVLLVPLAFATLTVVSTWAPSDTVAIVRPPGVSGWGAIVETLAYTAAVVLPLATLAAWRTRVYARQVLERNGRGWKAVGEAALCGFACLLLMMGRGIVTRPLEAPPYVIFYGTIAAILGCLVGMTLRMTALLTLRLTSRSA